MLKKILVALGQAAWDLTEAAFRRTFRVQSVRDRLHFYQLLEMEGGHIVARLHQKKLRRGDRYSFEYGVVYYLRLSDGITVRLAETNWDNSAIFDWSARRLEELDKAGQFMDETAARFCSFSYEIRDMDGQVLESKTQPQVAEESVARRNRPRAQSPEPHLVGV